MARPKPSSPVRRSEQHRVGRRIRSREVRVIDQNGQQLGVLQIQDALRLAEEATLELVEVNPKAAPPVCKIMDYGRFKYELAKREREAKKNQKVLEIKEIKLRPKTHDHDFDFKVRHVRRFLEEGDKVRLMIQFRGREMNHPETGRSVMDRVCKEVADIATVAQVPAMEGARLNMILAPKVLKTPSAGSAPKPPRLPQLNLVGEIEDGDEDDSSDSPAT